MKKIFYNVFLLMFICGISGALLGIVYEETKKVVEEKKGEGMIKTEVLPGVVRFVDRENISDGYDKDGNLLGRVIKVWTNGYGGKIEMLVGIDLNKRITGIKILNHNETLEIGSKITENYFLDQFLNKSISEIDLKSDGGTIDAITGATISSRAVINGIKSIEKLNE